MTMPALPPGFEMDAPPALPPGFELDAPEPVAFKGGKAQIPVDPTLQAPARTGLTPVTREPSPIEKFQGVVEAARNTVNSMIGGGVGGALGLIEGLLTSAATGKDVVPETIAKRSQQGTNFVSGDMGRRGAPPGMDLGFKTSDVGAEYTQNVAQVGELMPAVIAGPRGMTGMGLNRAGEAVRNAMPAGVPVKAQMQGMALGAERVADRWGGIDPEVTAAKQRVRTEGVIAKQAAEKAPSVKDAPAQRAIDEARAAGYSLSPEAARAGKTARSAEAVLGRKELADELAVKNQEVTNKKARADIGLDEDTPSTREALDGEIRSEGGKYAVVAKVGKFDHDSQFKSELGNILKDAKKANESYPGVDAGENRTVTQIRALDVGEATTESTVAAVKVMREESAKAYARGDTSDGKAYRRAAQALDDAMDRALTKASGNDPQLAGAVDEYRAARKRIAKLYLAQDALDGMGNFDASVYGKAVKDKPTAIDGPGREIGNFHNRFGEKGLSKKPGKLVSSPVSDRDMAYGAAASIRSGSAGGRLGALGAVLNVRKGGRALLKSDTVQERMAPTPKTPDPDAVFDPNVLAENVDAASLPTIVKSGGEAGQLSARPAIIKQREPGIDPLGEPGAPNRGVVFDNAPLDEKPPSRIIKSRKGDVERRALQDVPAVEGRPDVPEQMNVGAPAEVGRTAADNAGMVSDNAALAREQQGLSMAPGKEAPPPVGEAKEVGTYDPRLAEIERLRAATENPAVRDALAKREAEVKRAMKAEDAARKREADADALDAAAKQTTDPEIKATLRAEADKLREKIPTGETTEGLPADKAPKQEKIPVGKAKEVAAPEPITPAPRPKLAEPEVTEINPERVEGGEPIPKGEATEVEPVPVGQADELLPVGEAAEVLPVGEVSEILPAGDAIDGPPPMDRVPMPPAPKPRMIERGRTAEPPPAVEVVDVSPAKPKKPLVSKTTKADTPAAPEVGRSTRSEQVKEPWNMTREEAAKDYPGDEYDKMINRAADLGDLPYAEADLKSRVKLGGGKKLWAQTRAEIAADGKGQAKDLTARRVDVNKLVPTKEFAKWRIRVGAKAAQRDIDGAKQYTQSLLDVHKERVEEALLAGHDVPSEVLNDYPDLKAKYATTTPKAPASEPRGQDTQARAEQPRPDSPATARTDGGENLRNELRTVEQKILNAVPQKLTAGGGDIEAAARHRNAPKDLVARRKEIKAELRGEPSAPKSAGWNPGTTDPKTMTAGKINTELDFLDRYMSLNTDDFIQAGRGNERPSDYLSKTDPLSMRARELRDRYSALRQEIEARYGPNAPHRLPPKFGPREQPAPPKPMIKAQAPARPAPKPMLARKNSEILADLNRQIDAEARYGAGGPERITLKSGGTTQTISNTAEGVAKWRAEAAKSYGFKDTKAPKPPSGRDTAAKLLGPEPKPTISVGKRAPKTVVQDFVADGDFENAQALAEHYGLDIKAGMDKKQKQAYQDWLDSRDLH